MTLKVCCNSRHPKYQQLHKTEQFLRNYAVTQTVKNVLCVLRNPKDHYHINKVFLSTILYKDSVRTSQRTRCASIRKITGQCRIGKQLDKMLSICITKLDFKEFFKRPTDTQVHSAAYSIVWDRSLLLATLAFRLLCSSSNYVVGRQA